MPDSNRFAWDRLGRRENPSWYLDPIVAVQKRRAHLALIASAARHLPAPRRVLKTDLFEDAFGEDQLLGDFPIPAALLCGLDTAQSTTARAARRFPSLAGGLATADFRALPFQDGAFDLIVSPSSLDHFDSASGLHSALSELTRVLAPGGVMIVTFDNPWNPLYHVLRWAGRFGLMPFPLGLSPAAPAVAKLLEAQGLEVLEQDWLIHNPRGLSTALFLVIRFLFRHRADAVISAILALFAALDRLPTRPITACFSATIVRKQ